MIIKQNTIILGEKVVLVPYRREHVPKYHQWMQSEELQRLTASEPLTLEQEYEMQKSWQMDNNKCTFIILDRKKYEENDGNEELSMIGDTNLFFISFDEQCNSALVAEAEIMIAEPWARGQGCGIEAMLIMLNYGIVKLNIQHYVVKISLDNSISIHMFESMGFKETSRSDVFQEITLEKLVDNNFRNSLRSKLHYLEIKEDILRFIIGFVKFLYQLRRRSVLYGVNREKYN